MRGFGALVVGDEILVSKRQDKHLAFLIGALAKRGLRLAWCEVLGDDPARITATLARTFASGDAVFSFGGETTPQRLKMGEFPAGAEIIPNPFNRIPGFSVREHWFVPGFPQMAWPMVEWVLDTKYRQLFDRDRWAEESVIVHGLPESSIAPLMEEVNARYAGVKAFSLPSMGEGGVRRHIELGVRGVPAEVGPAIEHIRRGIAALGGAIA